VVGAFVDQVGRAVQAMGVAPQRCGLILAPSGHGDSASRAQSYRLARLLWEELGLARAESVLFDTRILFLRLCWRGARRNRWRGWCCRSPMGNRTRSVRAYHDRKPAGQCELDHGGSTGAHPMFTAWYAQRITRLWQEKRARETVRVASPRHASAAPALGSKAAARLRASRTNRLSLRSWRRFCRCGAGASLVKVTCTVTLPERIPIQLRWICY